MRAGVPADQHAQRDPLPHLTLSSVASLSEMVRSKTGESNSNRHSPEWCSTLELSFVGAGLY